METMEKLTEQIENNEFLIEIRGTSVLDKWHDKKVNLLKSNGYRVHNLGVGDKAYYMVFKKTTS